MKIGIVGYPGKMSQAILAEIVKHPDISLVMLHSRQTHMDQEIEVTTSIEELVKKCDIVIDFSHPQTALEVIEISVKNHVGVVCGTTGFTNDEMNRIKELSTKGKIFYAANMSLGIAILSQAIQLVVEGFLRNGLSPDVSILERHHKHKLDKPSGTAKAFANLVQDRFNTTPDIVSLRYGSNIIENDVIISTDMEAITLQHKAMDRQIFAAGALAAAKFLYNQEDNRLYNMDDIIK
jgi:4-hydroxy-tetrahydrodipicolinate reductase